MSYIYFFILASVLCYVQAAPAETESKTISEDALHLYVENSTKSTNNRLPSIMTELEDVEDEIASELESILPYINFLFDALLGRSDDQNNDDDCMNDMVIQLVADDTTDNPDTQTETTDTTDQD